MTDSPSLASPQILLEWQTLECYPHERSPRWYSVGGIALLAFAAYGLFEGSWSTTLLAVSLGGIYFLLRNKPPRRITARITGLGFQIAEQFFPWQQLRTFWIIEVPHFAPQSGATRGRPKHIELHLTPTRFLQPEIVVFLDGTDPVRVRETLLQYLPERAGMEERMLDSFARFLKL